MIILHSKNIYDSIEALMYFKYFRSITLMSAINDVMKILATPSLNAEEEAVILLKNVLEKHPEDYTIIVSDDDILDRNLFTENTLIYYKNTPHNIKIYLDLDGVFADFEGFFREKGIDVDSQLDWMNHIVLPIRGGKQVFSEFKPIIDTIDFYDSIKHLNPVFYTATGYSEKEKIQEQKLAWVSKHFGNAKVIFCEMGKSKAKLRATPNSILIDDSEDNIGEWNKYSTGGIFIDFKVHSIKDLQLQLSTTWQRLALNSDMSSIQ